MYLSQHLTLNYASQIRYRCVTDALQIIRIPIEAISCESNDVTPLDRKILRLMRFPVPFNEAASTAKSVTGTLATSVPP